jgi:hypothetical protein
MIDAGLQATMGVSDLNSKLTFPVTVQVPDKMASDLGLRAG